MWVVVVAKVILKLEFELKHLWVVAKEDLLTELISCSWVHVEHFIDHLVRFQLGDILHIEDVLTF